MIERASESESESETERVDYSMMEDPRRRKQGGASASPYIVRCFPTVTVGDRISRDRERRPWILSDTLGQGLRVLGPKPEKAPLWRTPVGPVRGLATVTLKMSTRQGSE